jgi:hypothetical protein
LIQQSFHATVYSAKNNQKEETRAFLNTTNATSRCIHCQIASPVLATSGDPDFVHGIFCVLTGIHANMKSSIIAPSIAHLLVCQDSRFIFSHDFLIY